VGTADVYIWYHNASLCVQEKESQMIKTIVFDLGGVILDFSHKIIANKLSNISVRNETEIFDFIFKSGIEKLYDTGKISSQEFYKEVKVFLNSDISYETFSVIWQEIFYEKPEMTEFLRLLKKNNYQIVLLSNTNELHFNYCLNKYPILNIFDKYFLSYQLGFRKPDSEIFNRLILELNNKTEELLFIDDVVENITAANHFGINTIHYVSHDYFLQKMRELNIM
jgi:glucose-1-phosphatase